MNRKIGLIHVDKKMFPNLALMKISTHYKRKGDIVEWYSPLFEKEYDLIYASKIFNYSNYKYIPNNAIKGGPGFNMDTLPFDHEYPDYALYNIDYAMGYLTKGCINKCGFCIVPKFEGLLKKHADLEEFWTDQEKIMLLDNCLTDYKHADNELKKIIDNELRLNLTQGFNIRTIKFKIAKLLSKIKLWKGKQWHIAWDRIQDERRVLKGIEILNNAGIPNWKILCYILIGYDSSYQQDIYRINMIEKIGADPFVMVYKKNAYTKSIARWCNRKPIFKTCPNYEEYINDFDNKKEIYSIIKNKYRNI